MESGCAVFINVFPPSRVKSIPSTKRNFVTVDSLIQRSEAIPERAAALAKARKWAAEKLCDPGVTSIKKIRLAKGWSQVELAKRMETSQPHIARIEKGTDNITWDTCLRLARTLGIDMNTLEAALSSNEVTSD